MEVAPKRCFVDPHDIHADELCRLCDGSDHP